MINDRPGKPLHGQDRLATGNPVYNGASNAATFGTVDPSGYADRERRSGLAKALRGQTDRSTSGGAGVEPSQLVGETASRMDRQQVIRMLAARMTSGQGR